VRLFCRECSREWVYPCFPCANQFADYHEAETGHDMSRYPSPEPERVFSSGRPVPSWM
jgi:hypothetical protein